MSHSDLHQTSLRHDHRVRHRQSFFAVLFLEKATFDNTQYWISEVKNHKANDVMIVLVGNKLDLATTRFVSQPRLVVGRSRRMRDEIAPSRPTPASSRSLPRPAPMSRPCFKTSPTPSCPVPLPPEAKSPSPAPPPPNLLSPPLSVRANPIEIAPTKEEPAIRLDPTGKKPTNPEDAKGKCCQ
jgi:hypothetical protein